MKQVEEALDRFLDKKPGKGKIAFTQNGSIILGFHYIHLIFIFDIRTETVLKVNLETRTDRRVANAMEQIIKNRLKEDEGDPE